jgi:hypothetical protein
VIGVIVRQLFYWTGEIGIGIARSEDREDSIRFWREEGEDGENNEGELKRDSDSLRDRVCTQEKSFWVLSCKRLVNSRFV